MSQHEINARALSYLIECAAAVGLAAVIVLTRVL